MTSWRRSPHATAARSTCPTTCASCSPALASGDWWSMLAPKPLLLIAELSYKCPLHCPYCSNPLSIGDAKYSDELPTEDWCRVFREAAELGVLQLALTGGEPLVRKDCEILTRAATE